MFDQIACRFRQAETTLRKHNDGVPACGSLRSCPMNDRDRCNPRTVESHQTPPKLRPQARRRWGGRLFALSGLLLLTVGIALGPLRFQQHD
jgi:hypothetical protein